MLATHAKPGSAVILILISLCCTEVWFWLAEGFRSVRERETEKVIIGQNLALLIPALCWYSSLFITRFKKSLVIVLAILLGIVGLLGLLFVNVFYFVGTP